MNILDCGAYRSWTLQKSNSERPTPRSDQQSARSHKAFPPSSLKGERAFLFYHSVQLLYALGTHVPAAERDDVPYAAAEHTGLVLLAKNNIFSFNIYLKRVFLLYIHRASYLNGQDNAPKLIDLAYHTGGFHDSSLLVYICSAPEGRYLLLNISQGMREIANIL